MTRALFSQQLGYPWYQFLGEIPNYVHEGKLISAVVQLDVLMANTIILIGTTQDSINTPLAERTYKIQNTGEVVISSSEDYPQFGLKELIMEEQ